MGDKPCIFSEQTICFSFFQSCVYFYIRLSISNMLISVRFFSFFPSVRWKYHILIMHKKQSVKTETI